MEFDAKDDRILVELQRDARLTLAELGRRVHLSQPAVSERVKRLEDAGVITGYRAVINPLALGHAIRAVVRVGRVDFERMRALIEATPEISDAFNVTGEDSWILLLAVRDVVHLDEVLGRFCAEGPTATSVILKVLRERGEVRSPGALTSGTARAPTAPAAPAAARRARRRTASPAG